MVASLPPLPPLGAHHLPAMGALLNLDATPLPGPLDLVQLAAELRDRSPGLDLPQRVRDLLLGKCRLPHS